MKGGSNVLLTPQEVADQLSVSRKTVLRRWREWGLKRHELGYNQPRFAQRDVNNFIERTTYEI